MSEPSHGYASPSRWQSALAPLLNDNTFQKELAVLFDEWSGAHGFFTELLLNGTIISDQGKYRAATEDEIAEHNSILKNLRRHKLRYGKWKKNIAKALKIADNRIKERLTELTKNMLLRNFGLLPPISVNRLIDELFIEFDHAYEDVLEGADAISDIFAAVDYWFAGGCDKEQDEICDDAEVALATFKTTQRNLAPRTKKVHVQLKAANASFSFWESADLAVSDNKANRHLSFHFAVTAPCHSSSKDSVSASIEQLIHSMLLLLNRLTGEEAVWRKHRAVITETLHLTTGADGRLDDLALRLRRAIMIYLIVETVPEFVKLPALCTAIECLIGPGENVRITESVSRRISVLLEDDIKHRKACEALMKRLYNIRSRCVHGDRIEVSQRDVDLLSNLFGATYCSVLSIRRMYATRDNKVRAAFLNDVDRCWTSEEPFIGSFKSRLHDHWRNQAK